MSGNDGGADPSGGGDRPVITDEASFLRYFALFNAPDNKGFTSYYTDDVQFDLGAAHLTGRAAIIRFYEEHQAHLEEDCDLLWLTIGATGMAAEIHARFRCLADWPDFPPGPLVVGDVREIRSWVHYELRDGQISKVRVKM